MGILNPIPRRIGCVAAFIAMVVCLNVASVFAATITWGSPAYVKDSTDVSTTGTLKYAYVWRGTDHTLNGVLFKGTGSSTNVGTSPYDLTIAPVSGSIAPGIDIMAFRTPDGITGSYGDILQAGLFVDYADKYTISLNNLTSGHNYQIQIWSCDSYYDGGNTTITCGDSVVLDKNKTNTTGPGQYVIGTFTAGATAPVLTFSGTQGGSGDKGPVINGLQVREVTGGTTGGSGPTVTINQASGQADPTSGSTINFTVVFSAAVTDFAASDVTLATTGGPTLTKAITGSGATYNVAVTGMTSATGTVTATIAAGVAHDASNNANVASTSTDNTVTFTAGSSGTGPIVPAKLANLKRPIKMINIPGGTFTMGGKSGFSDPATPTHQVTVSAFAIQETEVTIEQYAAVLGRIPANAPTDSLIPAWPVNWFNGARFCNTLSKMESLDPCYDTTSWTCDFSKNGYRLPTEAQWEYANRGGTATDWFWGNDYSGDQTYSWDATTSGACQCPHEVATKSSNPFKLYDMTGNVQEWVNDWDAPYTAEAQTDPTGPATGTNRVVRDGCAGHDPYYSYSASRFSTSPGQDYYIFQFGFRVALPIQQTAIIPQSVSKTAALQDLKITMSRSAIIMTLPASRSGQADIAIYNVSGRQVYKQQRISGASFRLDVRPLAAGMYNAVVKVDHQQFSRRFVVAKGE
ncbi:MAG: SUMF1/EgtB/PvdO family nonheme iron enzyme [Chitinivibrionales bacterium]|nr:SUMF1/EgtB/PvdO family nonheme iron enzyme [Chitinivibrionales bacterium]